MVEARGHRGEAVAARSCWAEAEGGIGWLRLGNFPETAARGVGGGDILGRSAGAPDRSVLCEVGDTGCSLCVERVQLETPGPAAAAGTGAWRGGGGGN